MLSLIISTYTVKVYSDVIEDTPVLFRIKCLVFKIKDFVNNSQEKCWRNNSLMYQLSLPLLFMIDILMLGTKMLSSIISEMLNKGSSFKSVIRDEDTPSSLEYFWLYLPWTKVRNESKVVRFHIATVFTISLWQNSFWFRVVFVLIFSTYKTLAQNIYS